MDVKGKIVIITGSAMGLGKAFARKLLEAGAKVCLSDLQDDIGLDTLTELGEIHGETNVHFIKCDVTNTDDLESLYDGCEAHFGAKVDIFCNNAGVSPNRTGWKKCMDINIMAVMAGTYLAMERMDITKGGRGGLIVNTASIFGIMFGDKVEEEAISINSYFVSKHGVVALTRSLGNSTVLGETGVGLQCICPNFAYTNIITDGLDVVKGEKLTKKIKEEMGIMSPDYVAEGFYQLITKCGNGTALVVLKQDGPFIVMPDTSPHMLAVTFLGAKMLGVNVLQSHHQIVLFILFLLAFYFIFGMFLSIIF